MSDRLFKPTPAKWARIYEEVRAFNNRIDRLERKGYPKSALPGKLDDEDVVRAIKYEGDFERIIGSGTEKQRKNKPSILQRSDPRVRPDALDINPQTGHINWADRELKNARVAINKKRGQLRRELDIENWEDLSYARKAQLSTYGNLAPLSNKYSIKEINKLWRMKAREELPSLIENYLGVWEDNAIVGREYVHNIIMYFQERDPLALRRIFNEGDDRVNIDYIYINSLYKNLSAEQRHINVCNYWHDLYVEYFNEEPVFVNNTQGYLNRKSKELDRAKSQADEYFGLTQEQRNVSMYKQFVKTLKGLKTTPTKGGSLSGTPVRIKRVSVSQGRRAGVKPGRIRKSKKRIKKNRK